MPQRLLTITGGSGRIGTALTPLLREQYRVRLADQREPHGGAAPEEYVRADVADLADEQRAVSGASAGLNGLWISTRDLAQIVRLCLETPRRFGIYNATSNNSQHHWDLQASRHELGYQPVDDVTQVQVPGEGAAYVDPTAGVLRAESQ